MGSTRRRLFTQADVAPFLEALRVCRNACINVNRTAPFNSPEYLLANHVTEAIDECRDVVHGTAQSFSVEADAVSTVEVMSCTTGPGTEPTGAISNTTAC